MIIEKAGDPPKDPKKVVAGVKEAGYATDVNYVTKVVSAMELINKAIDWTKVTASATSVETGAESAEKLTSLNQVAGIGDSIGMGMKLAGFENMYTRQQIGKTEAGDVS